MKFDFRVPGISQKKLFFNFCQISAIFDDFSYFCSTFSALHFEKSSNLAQIWQKLAENSLFDLPETHFSIVLSVPETQILGN